MSYLAILQKLHTQPYTHTPITDRVREQISNQPVTYQSLSWQRKLQQL